LIYLGLFFSSLFLTYFIKKYTLKKSILDIPNERSSHTTPTPRGGGLAIIITFYTGVFIFRSSIDMELFLALFTALPIAIISLVDDIQPLSSKVRLIVQSFSTILALYFLGGVNSIDFTLFQLSGWWLNIIAFFSILWLTNLYNFLDGIDGYAGTQTIIMGLGLFLFFSNPLGLVLLVGSLGFLLFNWYKASIFMGDVGSATLGFIIAIFIFSDTSNGNIYIWLVLLSLFWIDATVTLVRRYLNNESIGLAHRKHAYQRLTQVGWSHSKVVFFSIIFNLVFLLLLNTLESIVVFFINIIILVFILYWVERKKSFLC
jgi:Fuc2NAc and GlcNAc transferase